MGGNNGFCADSAGLCPGTRSGPIPGSYYELSYRLRPVETESLKLEITQMADGRHCLTLMNRVSLSWQVKGYELGLQADNVVVLLSDGLQSNQEGIEQLGPLKGVLDSGIIDGIFLFGDVVLEEGLRSIRCDEMYYDNQGQPGPGR